MKRLAIALLLATIPGLNAQDAPNPNENVTRVFELKYVSPSQMARLLGQAFSVQADDALKVVVVTRQQKSMAETEQMIKRLDVPPPPIPNVEVTIYLMSALAQPATAAVPGELEAVVKQLQNMFSYKGYQLIDTQVIRVRAGQGGEASGVVDRNASGPKTLSDVKFGSAKISTDEKGRAIHIDQLRVGLRMPIQPPAADEKGGLVRYANTGIFTDVDVREGQKVVVGKANMDGSDRASIVVLTAKVVD